MDESQPTAPDADAPEPAAPNAASRAPEPPVEDSPIGPAPETEQPPPQRVDPPAVATDELAPVEEAAPSEAAQDAPTPNVPPKAAVAASASVSATAPATASAAGSARAADADAPRTAAAAELFAAPKSSDDAWEEEESLLSWQMFAVIFVVLLVLGVAAVKIFGGNKSDSGSAGGTPSASTETTDADITDNFAGTSESGLGTTSTGQKWEEQGTWGKKDGSAYVVAPNQDGGRSLALVDLKGGNGSVSADATTIANGWGLVFRYKGPFNYWIVTASPKFGTYNVVRVVDGKIVPPGDGKVIAKVKSGTNVTVEFKGNTINLKLDGQVVKTITDCFAGSGTKVGLVSTDANAKDARWGNFAADKIEGLPAAAPKDGDDCTGKAAGADGGAPTTSTGATPTTAAKKK